MSEHSKIRKNGPSNQRKVLPGRITLTEVEAIKMADEFLDEYLYDMSAKGKTGDVPDALSKADELLRKRVTDTYFNAKKEDYYVPLEAKKKGLIGEADVDYIKMWIRKRFQTKSSIFDKKWRLINSRKPGNKNYEFASQINSSNAEAKRHKNDNYMRHDAISAIVFDNRECAEMPGYTGGAIVHTSEYLEHRMHVTQVLTSAQRAAQERKQRKAEIELERAQQELEKKRKEEAAYKERAESTKESAQNAKQKYVTNTASKIAEARGKAAAVRPTKKSYTSADYAKWGNKIPSDASASDLTSYADFVLNKYANDYRAFNQFMDYMKQQIGSNYKTFVDIMNKKINSRQARNSRGYAPSTPTMRHSALSAIHFIGE